jgi:serine/threonine protein kinase
VAKFVDDQPTFDLFKRSNYEMGTYTGTLAFRAPETFLLDRYTELVDTWAAGCILFTLLVGFQPFYAPLVSELVAMIKKAEVDFNGPAWKSVSEPAKDLIRQLLQADPASRATVHNALAHHWFSAPKVTDSFGYSAPKTRLNALGNCRRIRSRKTSENVEIFRATELRFRRVAGRQSVFADAAQIENLI